MIENTPDRIIPIFSMSRLDEEITLLEDRSASLRQGPATVNGSVTITQSWHPMTLNWTFIPGSNHLASIHNSESSESSELNLIIDDCIVPVQSFSPTVEGVIDGVDYDDMDICSDDQLDHVIFHLPNYPDIHTTPRHEDKSECDGTSKSIAWSEVILESDEWQIRIQPYQDANTRNVITRESHGIILNGVGKIRRRDSTPFRKEDVKPLLEALHVFLSFALSDWMPPLLAVGITPHNCRRSYFLRNTEIAPKFTFRGWLSKVDGDSLSIAFPGFMERWKCENWRIPLSLAVTWLIEVSRHSGGIDGAIAFGQIPLEMLAWQIFVDDRAIVDARDFRNLSAASKLQMLLAHCNISLDIPEKLRALKRISRSRQRTGPQLLTEVRNTIVHPNQTNRKKLIEWADGNHVSVNDIRWEAKQLFGWYTTLVLLYLIGYNGKYCNRLSNPFAPPEEVPWAGSAK